MTQLLINLSKELQSNFEGSKSPEELHSNLSTLVDQLQSLITVINQNRFIWGNNSVLGITDKIKLLECLFREATQIHRNAEADTLMHAALNKEIKRRRRVLRKLQHGNTDRRSTRTAKSESSESDAISLSRTSLRFSPNLSPIRESIPLPPPSPTVRFRSYKTSSENNSTSSSLDTDQPLEFDLVCVGINLLLTHNLPIILII